jgi:NADP-dependent 3-hydroxy acid dehydrogenase YdfG
MSGVRLSRAYLPRMKARNWGRIVFISSESGIQIPAEMIHYGVAGAVMASLVSALPQLVWISEHKIELFVFAGSMLALSGISNYRTRNAPCPADPAQMKSCLRLRRLSRGILYFSSLIYAIGFFFAFLTSWIAR